MKNHNTDNKELYDWIVKDINQITPNGFGEGAAACQVCASECREGEVVVAYAYRPAGSPTVRIGYIECVDCWRTPTESFTLGVRELVVKARIGRCMDVATQSSWPVLITPELRLYSPPRSRRAHPRPDIKPQCRNRSATGDAPTATRPSALSNVPQEIPVHLTSDADDHSLESPTAQANEDRSYSTSDRGDRL